LQAEATFPRKSEDLRSYAVLARVSPGCSPLPGRLPTCYSPVRRSTRSRSPFRARLACVRHAASVHSEPGSNSPVESLNIRLEPPSARLRNGQWLDRSTAQRTDVGSFLYSIFKEPTSPNGTDNLMRHRRICQPSAAFEKRSHTGQNSRRRFASPSVLECCGTSRNGRRCRREAKIMGPRVRCQARGGVREEESDNPTPAR
jgi:hypothetical protein